MRRARFLLLSVTLLSCGGSGGGAELFTATARDADGQRATMAVLADDSAFTAYVCSDDPASDGYSGWFHGSLEAEAPSHVAHDGWRLVAQRTADGIDVAVTSPDGGTHRFGAARARADGITGLYTANGGACTTGVIVIGGDVRGASCDDAGRLLQVTPARPLALVEGELPVEVQTRRFLVAPLRSVRP